jgi:hypothetical protein
MCTIHLSSAAADLNVPCLFCYCWFRVSFNCLVGIFGNKDYGSNVQSKFTDDVTSQFTGWAVPVYFFNYTTLDLGIPY